MIYNTYFAVLIIVDFSSAQFSAMPAKRNLIKSLYVL